MEPELGYGDYVTAESNGTPIEGRVVRAYPGFVLVQAACGRLARVSGARRVAGVWARVCQIVKDRATFRAAATPATVTVEVGGERVVLSARAGDVGKSCGWRGTATGYLEVVGLPHLCKITVTIAVVGSTDWGHRNIEHPDPNRGYTL